jgi:CSLREA domain-containing protein
MREVGTPHLPACAANTRSRHLTLSRYARLVFTLMAFFGTVAMTARSAEAVTYTVTSTDDTDDLGTCPSGDTHCTLREAMRMANEDGVPVSQPSDITFNITTGCTAGVCTIHLATNLPTIVDNDTRILGFTQLGNLGSITSDLGTRPGVQDSGNTCTQQSTQPLTFTRPRIAIDGDLLASVNNPFSIGPDASRVLIEGIAVYGAGPVTGPLEPDLASAGVTDGHAIVGLGGGSGTDRVVNAVFVGVTPDGTSPNRDPSSFCSAVADSVIDSVVVPGVDLAALTAACSAVGVGNMEFGVRQLNPGVLKVTGSYIGFNGKGGIDGEASGSSIDVENNEVFQNGRLSESHDGIDINGINSLVRCNVTRNNRTLLGDVKGDAGNGVEIGSSASNAGLYNNILRYNTAFQNLAAGFGIRKGQRGDFYEKNMSFENHVGISVDTEGRVPTNRHEFTKNSTFRNRTQGIDLQAASVPNAPWTDVTLDHVTPNDHCDMDGGDDGSASNTASNDLQNYPIVSSATNFGSFTQVSGTLDSTRGRRFRIEFFRTPDGDSNGPEGEEYLGATYVTTANGGLSDCTGTFSVHLAAVPAGDEITTTATYDPVSNPDAPSPTDPWSTSEYSPAVNVNNFVPEGKVTGGGYIEPVAATCNTPYCTNSSGSPTRANFGFNASYHKDNPRPYGHLNFVYTPGDLHFDTLDYAFASLMVNYNAFTKMGDARWSGNGKVNNKKGFCFQAYVQDRGEPGTFDTFHITIWQNASAATSPDVCTAPNGPIVYDNNADTILGGGNIQVHKPQ